MIRSIIQEQRTKQQKIEVAVTVVLIVYFSDGLDALGILETGIAAASYLLIPFLAALHIKRFSYFASKDVFILALTLLASFSIFWSESPGSTLENSRALIRITVFGIYLATRYDWRTQIKLVLVSLGISSILALIIGIIMPSTGILANEWRGGFPHKNYLARTMVITSILAFITRLSYPKNRWFSASIFCLAVLLILLSDGKTALVQLVFSLFVLVPIARIMRQPYKVRTLVLVIVLPILSVASFTFVQNFEKIAIEVFEKSNSLSGRSRLLEVLWQSFFWEKPIWGYGYSGFWKSRYDEVYIKMAQGLFNDPWVPTHAHNGFLDLGLSLGILGLLLFLASFSLSYIRSILFVNSCKTFESVWPFFLLTLFFASNINVNQSIISPTELLWPLYVSTTLSLAVERERASRLRQTRLLQQNSYA